MIGSDGSPGPMKKPAGMKFAIGLFTALFLVAGAQSHAGELTAPAIPDGEKRVLKVTTKARKTGPKKPP